MSVAAFCLVVAMQPVGGASAGKGARRGGAELMPRILTVSAASVSSFGLDYSSILHQVADRQTRT